MEEPIRVLVVDDHPLLRDGIRMLLSQQDDMEVVGEAEDGLSAVALFRDLKPDVALIDFQMPCMNGNELVREIRGEFPDARLIMLTTYKGDMQVFQALGAGVSGYILKDMMRKDLVAIIRSVRAGKRVLPPEIASELATHMTDDRLTRREVEILQLIAMGNSNKGVGQHLSLSEMTVKSHVRSILAKLGANDRTHAVTIGIKRGIILV